LAGWAEVENGLLVGQEICFCSSSECSQAFDSPGICKIYIRIKYLAPLTTYVHICMYPYP